MATIDAERLEVIRAHDAAFGPNLPDHYQAQHDRRFLLGEIDRLVGSTESYAADSPVSLNESESKHDGVYVPWLCRWVCRACFGNGTTSEAMHTCPGVHHEQEAS